MWSKSVSAGPPMLKDFPPRKTIIGGRSISRLKLILWMAAAISNLILMGCVWKKLILGCFS